ncbi:MAG TPA: hypothetical protein VN903_36010 [Polyangia bacterium]|nr:hypothetical protein [Polyangia bacterium]
MKKPRGKRWHAVVTKKEDVIVVKIALLLREVDYPWLRQAIIKKAFVFNGDARPKEWE